MVGSPVNCTECGKSLPQAGSLTQWLGLGDFCKCSLHNASEKDSPSSPDAVCHLCGLHLHRNTGSLTQWAFRRQTCNCLPYLTKHRLEIKSDANQDNSKNEVFPVKSPGSKIGRHYQVVSFIGEGGASAVYKVRHDLLDKEFAAKVLLPNRVPSDTVIKRFQQEGRSIGRLKHRNIVVIHEFDVDANAQPFLVMDFLQGKTLSALIQETGGLEPFRAASIFQQIADALEHAHAHSVIHRDLKPNNVIIAIDEHGQETVKLVDFGIAKLEESDSGRDTLTKTGEIFGSPHYMSPEQCKGQALDARTDIYSFGCLMYEVLAGNPAAAADSVFDILMLHLNGLKINLDETECGITLREKTLLKSNHDAALQHKCFTGLKQIIEGCLQVSPEKRYPTATAIKKDLALVRGGNDPQGPSSKRGMLAQKYLSSRLSSRFKRPQEIAAGTKHLNVTIGLLISSVAILLIAIASYIWHLENNPTVRINGATDLATPMLALAHSLEKDVNSDIASAESSGQSAVKAGSAIDADKNNVFADGQPITAPNKQDSEFWPANRVSVKELEELDNNWNLLAADSKGMTCQSTEIDAKTLKKLDQVNCDRYIIRDQKLNKTIFSAISSMNNIKLLIISNCQGVTAEPLSELRKSRCLKQLHLQCVPISEDCSPVLAELPLEAVSFQDSAVSEKVVHDLSQATQIKYISLQGTKDTAHAHLLSGGGWRLLSASDGRQWYCRAKGNAD